MRCPYLLWVLEDPEKKIRWIQTIGRGYGYIYGRWILRDFHTFPDEKGVMMNRISIYAESPGTVGCRRVAGATVIMFLLPAAVLLGAAGTMDWPMAWVYLGMTAAFGLVSRIIIMGENPDLLAERSRGLGRKDTPGWDRTLMPLTAIAGPLVMLLVAGLDKRFAGSPPIFLWMRLTGIAVLAAGCLIGTWATVANRYFSAVVRIQKDRGHEVVSSGPYRVVRHPGYAGAIAAHLAFPVMAGVLWALVPAVIVIGLIVLRTVLEDRILREQLEGYWEYSRRVRFRLLPGIW